MDRVQIQIHHPGVELDLAILFHHTHLHEEVFRGHLIRGEVYPNGALILPQQLVIPVEKHCLIR